MLNKKQEVNYRKAIVSKDGRDKKCKYCMHRQWTPIKFSDLFPAESKKILSEWRCDIIGLECFRKYAIADDHVCDSFERVTIRP